MNSSNTKLKPLDHKKSLNSQINNLPTPATNTKIAVKKPSGTGISTNGGQKKNVSQKPAQANGAYQKVKYTRSSNRTASKVQLYECNDFDMPGLEDDDSYFEQQLQKNIKVQVTGQKTQKVIPKNQVVLPKLEVEMNAKQMKDIQKQMDLEMSKMLDKQMSQDL